VKKYKFLFSFIASQIEEARDGLRKKKGQRRKTEKRAGRLQSVIEKE